jgi:hypothetical protein
LERSNPSNLLGTCKNAVAISILFLTKVYNWQYTP